MKARCRTLAGKLFSHLQRCAKTICTPEQRIAASGTQSHDTNVSNMLNYVVAQDEGREPRWFMVSFYRTLFIIINCLCLIRVPGGDAGACWSGYSTIIPARHIYNHSYLRTVRNFTLTYLTFIDWGCSTFLLPSHLIQLTSLCYSNYCTNCLHKYC